MSEKRYYWLKLQSDFFNSKRIKKLRKLAGGDTYTIIYLKMQLLAMQSDGILKWSGLEEDFASELALDLDETPENVEVTLRYLLSCGLAETDDNVSFFLPWAVANTGSETAAAERMRRMREKMSADVQKLPARSNAERQRAFRAKQTCEKRKIPLVDDHTNHQRYGGNYYFVAQRDRYKCAICGGTDNLCVHHIDGFDEQKPENNAMNKLVFVCRSCHQKVHRSGLAIPEEVLDSIGYFDTLETVTESVTPMLQPCYTEIDTEKEKRDRDIYSAVVEAWNALGLNEVRKITGERERLLKARIKEYGEDGVLEAIGKIKVSKFLMGGGDKGWTITFDWFLGPRNFAKVLEGNYSDKGAKVTASCKGEKPTDMEYLRKALEAI